MVPIWGKLGDMYGRKLILIIGICIFVAGSWLCGLSGEFGDIPLVGGGMMQLIVFRGIQGIGGGALFTTAFATIADLFPPRERGKYAGLFGAVFGVASVFGPIIGGWLTDHGTTDALGAHIEGWRWVFYVNLPTSILALFMIAVKMPDIGTRSGHKKIDYVGAVLIVIAIGALMLALTFGPTDGWTKPSVLGLLALALVAGLIFLAVEQRTAEPILPLSMFKIPAFTTTMLSSFIISMAFMGTIIFLPLYLQVALGVKATNSGLTLLPLMAGLIMGSYISGQLVTKTGTYKPFLLVGAALQLVGMFCMSQVHASSGNAAPTLIFGIPIDVAWRLLILGLGLGPTQSLFNIIAQSAAPMNQIGVATSTSMFLRQTGGLIGVAIFGALMTAKLSEKLAPMMPKGMTFDLGRMEAMAMSQQSAGGKPMAIPPFIANAFADAMSYIFLGSLFIIAIAFISILFIPQIELRGRGPQQASPNKRVADAEAALADAAPSPADPAPMPDGARAD
jgi:EmrB/QacA subfamily drug resistance transporter